MAAAFDGFVDEGCCVSEGPEYGADGVDFAFAPSKFAGELLVLGRQLDEVDVGGLVAGIGNFGVACE